MVERSVPGPRGRPVLVLEGEASGFDCLRPSRPRVGWVDLAVIPVVAVLSVPALLWFGDHPWTVLGKDAPRYLFAGSELVSGGASTASPGLRTTTADTAPFFPALIGSLMLVLGRDTESLVWAMRLMALLNPLLAYLLAKRLSGPPAGLLAAALLTLFGFNVQSTFVLNIDALLLTFTLLALLALLAAIEGRRFRPALAFLSGLLLGAAVLTKETAFALPPPCPARRSAARLGVARGALALPGRSPCVPAVVGLEVVGHRRGVPGRPTAALGAAPRHGGGRDLPWPRHRSLRLGDGGSLPSPRAPATLGRSVCGSRLGNLALGPATRHRDLRVGQRIVQVREAVPRQVCWRPPPSCCPFCW